MAHPKVATIVPLNHLETIKDDEYFMALSHAADNDDYLNFFAERSAESKCVILDNSAVELGHPEPFSSYFDKAYRMKASVIMLPDHFQDRQATYNAAVECMFKLAQTLVTEEYNPSIMCIPQGKSFFEWMQSVEDLINLEITMPKKIDERPGVVKRVLVPDLVGISCRYTDMFEGSRVPAIDMLTRYLRNYQKIHLLGAYANPLEEIQTALKYHKVVGVDSSYPCVYTSHGQALRVEHFSHERPSRDIDFLEDRYDEGLLKHNMKVWWNACLQ